MDPNARRPPVPESWLRPSRRPAAWRGVLASVVLGWLVLMTVWGFGRSGFPDHERWFLVVGIVAGVAVTVLRVRRSVTWSRASRTREH